jgi:hypothetical protein
VTRLHHFFQDVNLSFLLLNLRFEIFNRRVLDLFEFDLQLNHFSLVVLTGLLGSFQCRFRLFDLRLLLALRLFIYLKLAIFLF